MSRKGRSSPVESPVNACKWTDSRDGSRRRYRVDPHGVAGMREYLDRFWSDALAAFESAAKTEEER